MPTRIALIAYACDPRRGTEPGSGWQWAKHLAQAGYTVDLITRLDKEPNSAISVEITESRFPGEINMSPVPPGSRATSRTAMLPPHIRNAVGNRLDYLSWLHELSRRPDLLRNADLIHHVTYGTLGMGSIVPPPRTPLVFGPVSGGHVIAPQLRPLLLSRSDRGLERLRDTYHRGAMAIRGRAKRTIQNASIVVAANTASLRAAARAGARSLDIMAPDAIESTYISNCPRIAGNNAPTVLWVGGMHAIKAPLLAIDIFEKIARGFPSARLRMVGTGPMLSNVRSRAMQSLFRHRIDVAGALKWVEMKREYDDAAVFLFTSLRDTFGAQCLEAMARGLPVVGVRQHGLMDFTRGGGTLLVSPSDPQAVISGLADATLALLTDPTLYSKISEGALRSAAALSWPARMKRISRVYENTIS